MNNYNLCNLTEEKDLIEYEKKLYESFYINDPDGWIAKNYLLIDNCRLRSKISYNDQLIYCVKENDNIVFGMAVNINFNNDLQLEEMGFVLDKNDRNKKICEGLNLFVSMEMSSDYFEILNNVYSQGFNFLKDNGFIFIYSTCPEKLKRFYERGANFQVIDKKLINNSIKYLLKKIL